MTIDPGKEFNIQAAPSQELLRKLVYLAGQDNDSVLTGGLKSPKGAFKGSRRDGAKQRADTLQMARLADPQYQAMSERISGKLGRMDEASVYALQEIEEELLELRRERERMREQAYRDEQGRRIFMTEDESAAYYEDGTRLEDDEFDPLRERLHGKPTWEQWQDSYGREEQLNAERDQIHRHEAERDQLRDDLAHGEISQEEAGRRAQEIEDSLPERVRSSYETLNARRPENGAAPDPELSAEETALLDARADPAEGAEASGRGSPDAQPAADPPAPGASPFQPR